MSKHFKVEALLGAYLCADVTPEERNAIEARLAQDADLAALLGEYKEVIRLIERNERHVTPAMAQELKKRIDSQIDDLIANADTIPLLAASLTNDLSKDDIKTLGAYVGTHPDATAELQSLIEVSGLMAQNEMPVSDALSQKLKERLKQKLPAASLQPAAQVPVGQETVKVKLALPSESAARKTVRVLAYSSVGWDKWRWISAAAAAVALIAGVGLTVRLMNSGPETANLHPKTLPADQHHVEHGPAPVPTESNDNRIVQDSPKKTQENAVQPPINPNNTPETNDQKLVDGNEPKSPLPRHAPDQSPILPKNEVPKNDVVIRNDQVPVVPQDGLGPNFAPPPQQGNGIAQGPVPRIGILPNPLSPNQPPPMQPRMDKSLADLEQEATKKDAAVVAHVTGGAQAGDQPINRPGQHIKSDVPVFTGVGLIAAVTPGDGHLYVNRDTSLSLKINKENTTINLDSGEVSYKASSNGSLTINVRKVVISHAKAVNTQVQGNTLVVNILKDSAHVTAPKYNKVVGKNMSVIIDLSGNNPPVIQPMNSPRPDSWKDAVSLPGDSAAEEGQPNTSKKKKSKKI